MFFVPTFYMVTESVRGRSLSEATDRLRTKYWETLYAIWSVWGPMTAIMFAVVPEQHQVLYTVSVSFGWNVLLSLLSNSHVRSAIK